MMNCRATWFLLAVGLVVGCGTAAFAQTQRPDPAANKLPDGEGKAAVLEFCAGACHSSDRFVGVRKTQEEWRKTVLQMVANGAQLFPEDVDAVTKYLSTYLSTDTAASAAK
jgi:hypothetical protein